ncbi:hypothetical protein BC939DRAFT_523242, partial [Gamsiella multidivaricata]|uniref:uncharacterized protein n=1 Tax=Gamsiella multidivaricata TaxID=101098 RepID=UPI00221FBDEA
TPHSIQKVIKTHILSINTNTLSVIFPAQSPLYLQSAPNLSDVLTNQTSQRTQLFLLMSFNQPRPLLPRLRIPSVSLFHVKNNTYRLRSSSLHGSSQHIDKSSDENKESFPPGTPLHHDPAINDGIVSALSSIPSWLEEDISRVANPTPSTSDTHNRIVMPVIRGRSLSPKALSKRSRSTSPESDKDNKMRRFNSFREVIEGKPKLLAFNCPILPSPPALFTSTINPQLEKEKALEFVTNAVGQPYHDKVKTSLPLSSASHDGSQDLDTSSDNTATPTSGSKRKVSFQAPSNPPKLRRHDAAYDLKAEMYDPFLKSVESCKSWGIEKVDELTAKRLDLRCEVLHRVVIGKIHINAIPSCDQMKESFEISAAIHCLNKLIGGLDRDEKHLQKNTQDVPEGEI